MSKISNDDLRGAFKGYCDAVARAGYDVTNYRLQMGDSANTYRALDGGGGTIGTGSYGYLGDTKREAYRALYCMAELLNDMAYKSRRAQIAGCCDAYPSCGH